MRVFAFIGLFCVCFSGVIIAWTFFNELLDRLAMRRINRQPIDEQIEHEWREWEIR